MCFFEHSFLVSHCNGGFSNSSITTEYKFDSFFSGIFGKNFRFLFGLFLFFVRKKAHNVLSYKYLIKAYYLIFLFFINNRHRWCKIIALNISLKFWFIFNVFSQMKSIMIFIKFTLGISILNKGIKTKK